MNRPGSAQNITGRLESTPLSRRRFKGEVHHTACPTGHAPLQVESGQHIIHNFRAVQIVGPTQFVGQLEYPLERLKTMGPESAKDVNCRMPRIGFFGK